MLTITRKMGDCIVIGDVVVTVAGLATKSAELSLTRRDGTALATMTIGKNRLSDLVGGVQVVVLDVTGDHVRLGLESPASGLAHSDSGCRD